MTALHPADPEFGAAYGKAWTHSPEALLAYFTPEASYTDVAMGVEYKGHEAIARFFRFMLTFAPDSVIEFSDCRAFDGHLYAPWVWRGTCTGALRLRNGKLIDATGHTFSVPGIAACEYGADGRLTSHRDFWDLATVLDQAAIQIG